MTDTEIHDLIDKKNDHLIKNFGVMFDGYNKSITTLITMENRTMCHKIDKLTEKVERQNSSVRKLNEWKAKVTGVGEFLEKRGDLTWKKIGIIMMIIIGVASIVITIIYTS